MKRLYASLPFISSLFIILASVTLGLSSLSEQQPALFIGITYDLMVVSPLIYLLFIYRKPIPNITAVPVMLAGSFIAAWLLPDEARFHYNLLHNTLLPVTELGMLAIIAYYSYRTVKTRRGAGKEQNPDFSNFCNKVPNRLFLTQK
jgi:hypothetical protein